MRTALVAVFALLAFASPAFADSTYTDPAGEDTTSADITSIVVSNDPAARTVTLKTQIANMPTLDDTTLLVIAFDGDHNPATGDPSVPAGVDAQFLVDSTGWEFDRWDGTQFAQVTGLPIGISFANGLLTATFRESDLGTTGVFDFLVASVRGTDPATAAIDIAPNAPPLYTYTLTKPAAPTVTGSAVAFKIAPKAGKKAVVGPLSITLSDGTQVTASKESCSATLGGAHLAGTGAGGCTFTLPKKAKGKRLVVKVTASYGSSSVTRSLSSIVK